MTKIVKNWDFWDIFKFYLRKNPKNIKNIKTQIKIHMNKQIEGIFRKYLKSKYN